VLVLGRLALLGRDQGWARRARGWLEQRPAGPPRPHSTGA
jgi:hypothetical protein